MINVPDKLARSHASVQPCSKDSLTTRSASGSTWSGPAVSVSCHQTSLARSHTEPPGCGWPYRRSSRSRRPTVPDERSGPGAASRRLRSSTILCCAPILEVYARMTAQTLKRADGANKRGLPCAEDLWRDAEPRRGPLCNRLSRQ